jgi:ATP-binding cassette subfamily F protein uup
MLLQPASLLILDEPTNDLDVATLSALESMLVEMDGTALVVTHDRYFLDRVATSILAFEGDARVVRYGGNYTMYRNLRREAEERAKDGQRQATLAAKKQAVAAEAPKRVAVSEAPPAKKKGLTYGERLELDGMMEKIDAAEQAVVAAETELNAPDLFTKRGNEVPARTKALEDAKANLEKVMARWEELETKREGT